MLVTTMGNKGGLAYSFAIKNRHFNVIGCHLQHKLEKQAKRNLMSRQLINEIKVQQLQDQISGIESDQVADFNFILGDLNYRLKSTYEELASNVSHHAKRMA